MRRKISVNPEMPIKHPSKMPLAPGKERDFKGEPVKNWEKSPKVKKKKVLDRAHDEKLPDKIKILPPELVSEVRKLATQENSFASDVYEYLEHLIQDGEDFEIAIRKTYENVWPAANAEVVEETKEGEKAMAKVESYLEELKRRYMKHKVIEKINTLHQERVRKNSKKPTSEIVPRMTTTLKDPLISNLEQFFMEDIKE